MVELAQQVDKKVIWVKKNDSTTTNPVRRCLNCGKDISDKRKHAKFCSQACYQGYYNLDNSYRGN